MLLPSQLLPGTSAMFAVHDGARNNPMAFASTSLMHLLLALTANEAKFQPFTYSQKALSSFEE